MDFVNSKCWSDHQLHLREVLELLRMHTLYAKKSKCRFGQRLIDYLGHIISVVGVATDPDKISCMLSWPNPKIFKQLR